MANQIGSLPQQIKPFGRRQSPCRCRQFNAYKHGHIYALNHTILIL